MSMSCSKNCVGNESSYTFSFSNMSSMAWDNMALSVDAFDVNKWGQSAVLIGWVGHEIDTDYNYKGSGANLDDLQDLYEEMNITSQYGNYNKYIVWESLQDNMPVIVGAYATKNSVLGIPIYTDGHAWIIDGYCTIENQYSYIYEWTSRTENQMYEYGEIKTEIITESSDYILMNWGYDGDGDNTLYYPGGDWYETQNGLTYQYQKEILYNFQ